MVKVCSFHYPASNEKAYEEYYSKYPYNLHDFQKWSIQAITGGQHLLVCAPTGSGKTMPGEFALEYFHSQGKKTIYTTPIKALSNEKFYSFTQKYPQLRVGLITGDIKTNPDADVLIMTTEILLNKLYQERSGLATTASATTASATTASATTAYKSSSISFEMDFQTELGCVVFDEIHMINDESRGHVWEQCIMLLPKHVQMIGLSATLDNPEKFAYWLETRGEPSSNDSSTNKTVFLTKKLERSVPLIHYSFITTTNAVNKLIKDKATQEEIRRNINQPFVLQDEKGVFDEQRYSVMTKMLGLFQKNDIRVNRQHILNKVTEYLVQKEMLPALCYVFSRKQLEKCAQELTTNLLEFDSKIPYTVDRECEQIIRKLPNYEEYLHLPEYVQLVKLLRKGVGIHHAGIMPILREMVELLFARGFIKVLFCTETMSVGINLPVKTTIFTEINKFNGEVNRMLYSHEYTQAAGRAGRLGLDTIGHVIHLNNLFRNVERVSYKQMMSGKPQQLQSKFKISYSLLLNLIAIGDANFQSFAQKSMVTNDLDEQMKEVYYKSSKVQMELNQKELYISSLRTPRNIAEEYDELLIKKQSCVNKKRKDIEKQLVRLVDEYPSLEKDRASYHSLKQKENELEILTEEMNKLTHYIQSGVDKVLRILKDDGFLKETGELLQQGFIAANLKEIPCLVFAKLLVSLRFDVLSAKQLVVLFSCFTNITVQEDVKRHNPDNTDTLVYSILTWVSKEFEMYQKRETDLHINTGIEYTIHYDLMEYVLEWCDATNAKECKAILYRLNQEKHIFLGEFVKALLKIHTIANEMEKIAEMTGNITLLSKLGEIPMLTLKYVVTNQSLYV